MPDIVVTDWTRRALGIPAKAVKPHETPYNFVLNISRGQLASLQKAKKKGEPLEHTFFRMASRNMGIAPCAQVRQ